MALVAVELENNGKVWKIAVYYIMLMEWLIYVEIHFFEWWLSIHEGSLANEWIEYDRMMGSAQ